MTQDRLALDYGDGSFGVLAPTTRLDAALAELDFYNRGERPEDHVRLVTVRIEIVGPVEPAKAIAAA